MYIAHTSEDHHISKSRSSIHNRVHLHHLCKQNTWHDFITRKNSVSCCITGTQTTESQKKRHYFCFTCSAISESFGVGVFFPVKMARKNQNLSQIIVHQKDLKSADYNTDSTRITQSHQFGLLKVFSWSW